jgi:hypothetical protein
MLASEKVQYRGSNRCHVALCFNLVSSFRAGFAIDYALTFVARLLARVLRAQGRLISAGAIGNAYVDFVSLSDG